jgi:hypothetical protein
MQLVVVAEATGIKTVTAKACFTVSAYPAGDHGTGYDIGDIPHDVALKDQNGNVEAWRSRGSPAIWPRCFL